MKQTVSVGGDIGMNARRHIWTPADINAEEFELLAAQWMSSLQRV